MTTYRASKVQTLLLRALDKKVAAAEEKKAKADETRRQRLTRKRG